MKQVKAHIAVSLDGHTATLDNELDWLKRTSPYLWTGIQPHWTMNWTGCLMK